MLVGENTNKDREEFKANAFVTFVNSSSFSCKLFSEMIFPLIKGIKEVVKQYNFPSCLS